ncbi:glycosyltransferase [Thermobacillus sp. ZCTH02-B1]|uniref:glycosyltransferase n=1 Tax=Thermobacillus sp. ZCTH02-B1 TaxID=1858795 RepID=UPI002689994C
MRKKKLLFIMPGLAAGGGEKALVNLLGQLDYGRYDVDLFLLDHGGLFMDLLPREVRLLPLPARYERFRRPALRSVLASLRAGDPELAFCRVLYAVRSRIGRTEAVREQYGWRYLRRALASAVSDRYDAAIGFLEKTSTYFCVDLVRADRKIGWIHIDYDRLGMDPAFDDPYFAKLDHLVTVSEECAAVLKTRFPRHREKIRVIRNIVSPAVVRRLAEAETGDLYGRREGEMIIVSVGRLHPQKGFDLAIDACALLVEQGRKVRWFVIGEGGERERLEKRIRERGLEGRFVLLGVKANPYPYMRQADIYAQPSRFEGKPIAVDEAKMLGLPILVTDYPTAGSQIVHEKNGLIAAMEPEAIAGGLMRLMDDPALREQLVRNLALEPLGTEDEVRKFDALLEGESEWTAGSGKQASCSS